MSIRGILFDKDGTLLDYNATWVPINRVVALVVADGDAALARELLVHGGQDDDAGIVKPGSLLAACNTREIADAWSKLIPERGAGDPERDIVRIMDDVFQRQGAITSVPVEGLRETLSGLRQQGMVMGIATSDSEAGAIATLSPFDVLPWFDFVAGYDSGHGSKPEPGMVHGFCSACDLHPEEVLVVGDNLHDLEMGRNANAGMVIGVLSGTSARHDLEAMADHVVNDIRQLETVLCLTMG